MRKFRVLTDVGYDVVHAEELTPDEWKVLPFPDFHSAPAIIVEFEDCPRLFLLDFAIIDESSDEEEWFYQHYNKELEEVEDDDEFLDEED